VKPMSRHILILEDQAAVREVMVESIEDVCASLNIGEASSLAEARVLYQSQHWDLLITDYNLGDGKGLDLVEEIRAMHSAMPVILVSGFLSPSRVKRAEDLGVSRVIAKPFRHNELESAVKEVFEEADSDDVGDPVVPAQASGSDAYLTDRTLLPKLFDMDRNQSLLFRIINELPRHREVAQICNDALHIALDITRADRGFVCLYDRGNQKLVLISHHCNEQQPQLDNAPSSCGIDDTPFAPLLMRNKEAVESPRAESDRYVCWPQVEAENFMAVPMRLQETNMGVLCLMDRHADDDISEGDRHLLGMLIRQLDTLLDNRAVHAALADSATETLIALVHTLEARDRYTKDHSERVGKLAAMLAGGLGLPDDEIALIRMGGRLHDIGKSGIPDSVLLKEGRYTEREYAIMKAHPGIGDAILRHMDTLARERQIVRHHHERFDGHGYPDRLKGREIPLSARIVCVADSIDAMTTHRVYRMAQPMSFCIDQLQRNSGTQFDADVVEVALDIIGKGYVSTQARQEMTVHGGLPLSVAA